MMTQRPPPISVLKIVEIGRDRPTSNVRACSQRAGQGEGGSARKGARPFQNPPTLHKYYARFSVLPLPCALPCYTESMTPKYESPQARRRAKEARARARNPERFTRKRWRKTWRRRGIEDAVVLRASLFAAQDGKCAICLRPETTPLIIDHDHDSGRVRGLLCSACNRGIGMLQDSAEVVSSAASYLTRHSR